MALSETLTATAGIDERSTRAEPVSVVLRGISKSYAGVTALRPLDIELKAGELVSLLGPSGCGKTTTLRIVAGFVAPDAGDIIIGDRNVTDVAPNARGLGMVFQSYSLFPHMTVAENIAFGLRMRGIPRAARARDVGEALEMVRLERFVDRYPHELSGGQQQRVALARALITRPSVLLLDEPLGALDKNLRERMQVEIRDLQRRLRITTILVTHDQEEAMTMSDRIAVMSEGRLVQVGTPEEIYNFPQTRFVSEFLGTSNLFDAQVVSHEPRGVIRLRLVSGAVVSAVLSGAKAPATGDKVTVAVRPERIAPTDDAAGLEATLKGVTFRGSHRLYEFAVPGAQAPVVMSVSSPLDITPGETIRISWGGNAVILGDAEGRG